MNSIKNCYFTIRQYVIFRQSNGKLSVIVYSHTQALVCRQTGFFLDDIIEFSFDHFTKLGHIDYHPVIVSITHVLKPVERNNNEEQGTNHKGNKANDLMQKLLSHNINRIYGKWKVFIPGKDKKECLANT